MLGWHISVFRQRDAGAVPATAQSPHGARLAVWQTGVDGLDWLTDLVKVDKAVNLGGDGYPVIFTAIAEHLIPQIAGTPPGARTNWLREESDIVTDRWEGKTVVDGATIAQCRPEEWLIVVAWDES